MIPASERAKTVHALDRAATVIGTQYSISDSGNRQHRHALTADRSNQ
jgi:hypothetical protein